MGHSNPNAQSRDRHYLSRNTGLSSELLAGTGAQRPPGTPEERPSPARLVQPSSPLSRLPIDRIRTGLILSAYLVILSIPGFREPCAKHRNLKFLNSAYLVILSTSGFREPCAKHRNLKFLNSDSEGSPVTRRCFADAQHDSTDRLQCAKAQVCPRDCVAGCPPGHTVRTKLVQRAVERV